MTIQATENFDFLTDEYNRGVKGCLLLGGTRSGKTYSAVQFIFYYCLINKGKRIAVCRDTLTNLKRTTLEDFKAVAYGSGDIKGMYPSLKINKSDLFCEINGNRIDFIGLKDDPMRVYGLPTDLFYINEAVSTYKFTFNQLEQRCSEFFILDCNPSEPQSWVYELERRDDVQTLRTTYKDNPFLPSTIVKSIEGYEPTEDNIARGTANERMWSIYGKGLTFKGSEIIYPEWSTYENDPIGYDHVYLGLDWGFNHPLACVKVFFVGNEIYIRQLYYKSEPDIDEVEAIIKADEHGKDTYLVCDSAEPRAVADLIKRGLNAVKARKVAGSVLTGIRRMQQKKIHVHEDSIGVISEMNNYKWKMDNRTDKILDIPIKENDDALDAVRYIITTFEI
jgi:PBSX family phage terminase large subunit